MSRRAVAVDTSVAVTLLLATHPHREDVLRWAGDRPLALTGHSLTETYSVLTRLPDDARLAPDDAVKLLDEAFRAPYVLSPDTSADAHRELARLGIVGGAVYDGLVALAAREHGARLATRDARALDTYRAVGADVVVLAT